MTTNTKSTIVRTRKRTTWTPHPTNYGTISRKFLKANGLPLQDAMKPWEMDDIKRRQGNAHE